jgi:hypothetical protein
LEIIKKLLGIVVLGLLLSGNAYAIVSIGSETLPIITDPSKSTCILSNNKGSWSVITPGAIKIKRSKKPLKIVCKKDGYNDSTNFLYLRDPKKVVDVSNDAGDFLSNAISGDLIGIAVDVMVVGSKIFKSKFGTYATHKKNDKPLVIIKLEKE